MITQNPKKNKAFVMLFSAVISSIILAIALGVANIALKELSFDTSAKRTNDAFFAADTAIECALYYDLASDASAFGVPAIDSNASCAGTDIDLNNNSSVPTTGPWQFVLYPLAPSGNACAIINVERTLDPDSTSILARGYNIGGNTDDCSSSSQNRVERELLVDIGEVPSVSNYFILNVALSGSGLGSVSSDVGSISCPSNCSSTYPEGTLVTLTPTPQAGSNFTGWSGDCSGNGSCLVTMDAVKNVVASFDIASSFPVLAGTASSMQSSNTTVHTVALPNSIASGDLLLVFFSVDGLPGIVWPVGWNVLLEDSTTSPFETFAVAYKIANGSEGSSITINTTGPNPEQSSHQSFRITDHGHTASVPPELSYTVGSSNSPDSPNLTPSWGNAKNLWISALGREAGSSNPNLSYPANYINGFTIHAGLGNTGSTQSTAVRELEASSENPGAFGLTLSDLWVVTTIAIKPQ